MACWPCSTPGPAESALASPAGRASGSTTPIRSKLDPVAAAHPGLTVVAAHFGWPWHLDLTAIALHKTNVYIDISGWSPRRIPAEVIREMRGRLSGQFLWGSDFPFLTPERCLTELSGLGLPGHAEHGAARQRGADPRPVLTTGPPVTRQLVTALAAEPA